MKKVFVSVVIFLISSFCFKNFSSANPSALIGGHFADIAAQQAFEYKIMTDNCHNAANAGIDFQPDTSGIVICSGNSDTQKDLTGHTFNYKIQYLNEAKDKVNVSFYNWGRSKECFNENYPLDINDSCINSTVKNFCIGSLKNYMMYYGNDMNIRILPIGQKVEEVNVEDCAFETTDYPSCEYCCISKTSIWNKGMVDEANQKTYAEYIQALSNQYFGEVFIEDLKNRLNFAENEDYDSQNSQEFLDLVFKGLTLSEQERWAIVAILRDYILKKEPNMAMNVRFAEELANFENQCRASCLSVHPVSEKDLELIHNGVCPVQ